MPLGRAAAQAWVGRASCWASGLWGLQLMRAGVQGSWGLCRGCPLSLGSGLAGSDPVGGGPAGAPGPAVAAAAGAGAGRAHSRAGAAHCYPHRGAHLQL